MKKFICLFWVLTSSMAFAQDSVIKEICGVPFGTTYYDTYLYFKNIFQKNPKTGEQYKLLLYENVSHMGIIFPVLCMYFEYEVSYRKENIMGKQISENGDTIPIESVINIPQYTPLLDRADFIFPCRTKEEAVLNLMLIKEALSRKYVLNTKRGNIYGLSLTEQNDEFFGGNNPKDSNKYGFHLFVIKSAPYFEKDFPFSAILQYGPYGYGKE